MISVIGSAGLIGYKIYEESQPVDQKQTPLFLMVKKKTLVILGSGWGAISLLKTWIPPCIMLLLSPQETISFQSHCYHISSYRYC